MHERCAALKTGTMLEEDNRRDEPSWRRHRFISTKFQTLDPVAVASGRTAKAGHSWEAAGLLDHIREESQDTLIADADGENVSSALMTLLDRHHLLIEAFLSPFRNPHQWPF